jgi:hypothetical protein
MPSRSCNLQLLPTSHSRDASLAFATYARLTTLEGHFVRAERSSTSFQRSSIDTKAVKRIETNPIARRVASVCNSSSEVARYTALCSNSSRLRIPEGPNRIETNAVARRIASVFVFNSSTEVERYTALLVIHRLPVERQMPEGPKQIETSAIARCVQSNCEIRPSKSHSAQCCVIHNRPDEHRMLEEPRRIETSSVARHVASICNQSVKVGPAATTGVQSPVFSGQGPCMDPRSPGMAGPCRSR